MKRLKGLTVLVTRPEPQGEILCEKIKNEGGRAIYFPTLEIVPLHRDDLQTTFAKMDWLIFVSPQAVTQSLKFLKKLPSHIQIAAIGESSAHLLQKNGISVNCYPSKWNSEEFLKLKEFESIQGKKIGIVKGRGGRQFLEASLKERGALVTLIDVYKRQYPKVDPTPILKLLASNEIDMIVCTSIEGLENLKSLLNPAWEVLKAVPLLLNSERIATSARQLLFQRIVVAENASYPVLLESLAKEKNMIESTKVKEPLPQKKRWPWATIGILFSTFGVLILLFSFYFASFYSLKNISHSMNTRERQIALQNEFENLKSEITQLTQTVQEQNQALNSLRQTQTGYSREEWRMVEAQSLARIANDKLQLEGNVSEAIVLLQSADSEIRRLNDAKFLPVRQALANDITHLQAIPVVDITGIYARLTALLNQLPQLPLPNKPVLASTIQTQTAKDLPWWKRGLIETWEGLQKIVTVRYHQSGTLPLILPEQQDFLYQNLYASIEKSMWGLIHHQPEIYRLGLEQASIWVKRYFVPDSALTQSFLENLKQLQALDINPPRPKLLDSLKAFQDYFSSRETGSETHPAVM